MKFVFLIKKINDYDLFSPYIYYLLKKNIKILILHDADYKGGTMKKHLKPKISLSPFYNIKKNITHKSISFNINLENELLKSKCSYIFSAALPEGKKNKNFYDFISNKWCLIMDGTDIYFELKKLKIFQESILYKNLKINFYCWSNFFLNDIKKYLKKFDKISYKVFASDLVKKKISGAFFFSLKNKNILLKNKIKKNYNIPEHKKIILYLPMPYYPNRIKEKKKFWWQLLYSGIFIDHFPNIRSKYLNYTMNFLQKFFYLSITLPTNFNKISYILKNENEKEALKNLNIFCKRNNFFLISKPRKKFLYCDAVKKYSDLVINDNMQKNFPTYIDEFLSISDLLITYNSSANFRGICANVPTINIKPEKSFFPEKKDFYWLDLTKMYNYSGVIKTVSPSNFLKIFKSQNKIFNRNNNKMKIYKKKLFGNLNGISFLKTITSN
jgi:hypothetical protein